MPFRALLGAPLVTTLHGPMCIAGHAYMYRKFASSYYISISNSQRRPVPELNFVATVYNGIDLSNLMFRAQSGDKLVFLGRIHLDKGTHLAIDVAKRTGRDLLIAGIIQDQQYFDTLIKPHLNGSSIQYLGPADPVLRNELFRQAYATLHLNTIPERFGLVMAEAQACGTPVVGFNRGSVPELVAHGETGFVVSDVDEMVAAITRLDRIDVRRCREHVARNFDVPQMVDGYIAAYRRILSGRVLARDVDPDDTPVEGLPA
jgi:glycosyltransferase involved in cell wall biosynthesis